jgi:hypothetical protein
MEKACLGEREVRKVGREASQREEGDGGKVMNSTPLFTCLNYIYLTKWAIKMN